MAWKRCLFHFSSREWYFKIYSQDTNGPVHKGMNHVPKAVSDHDSLPDWVRDLNYGTCVHKHCKCRPNHEQDLHTAR